MLLIAEAENLDRIHEFHVVLVQSGLMKWASIPHSFLGMRKNSEYSDDERVTVRGFKGKYVFVYPFVKSREWYALPGDERWRIMQGHIKVGREYPGVDNHTTYSFGLDDQEFVVAFDTDDVGTFLDLVQQLRTTEASRFTVRDTPSFTCISMSLARALNALDGRPSRSSPRCRRSEHAHGPGEQGACSPAARQIRCSPALIAAVGPLPCARRAPRPRRPLRRARALDHRAAASVLAARAIYGRLTARFGDRAPTPREILDDDPEELRAAAGLSRAKVCYLRSLAEHVISGELELELLDELPDDEVIAELVAVKGLGLWTAQMFLMFHLERPDVLPVGDLGIRRAIERAYGLGELPDAGADGGDRRAVAAAANARVPLPVAFAGQRAGLSGAPGAQRKAAVNVPAEDAP